MAVNITYIGDSTHLTGETLRWVLEQPSEWIIRIEHKDGEVTGTICDLNLEGNAVTIRDHDDEDQATGAETTIDLHDIAEVEIF